MSNQQKSPHEEFILLGFTLFIIGGIAFVIWSVFSTELTSVLRWIRVGEMHLASVVVGDDYSVDYANAGPQYLGKWKEWLPTADPDAINFDYIKVMSQLALNHLKYLFAGLLGLMGLWSIFKGPGTYYRRKFSLDGLMGEQAKMFPFIAPFLAFNPNKSPSRAPGDPVPSKLPLFAEALAPEEWIAYHNIPFQGGKLEYAATYRALAKQLGPRWQGPRKLPIYARGIYAACALKSIRKRKESEDLLKDMALSWSAKSGFKPSSSLRSRINKVVSSPALCGGLNKYTRHHAYQTTAMLRALQRAREEGGVMASAQFVWLRGVDRNLWYPLNNLGRKSYHAEAAGALAHYTNELIAGQKIPSPRFEDVIKVFEKTLTGPDARKIPPRAK